jgi:hypothetical protein
MSPATSTEAGLDALPAADAASAGRRFLKLRIGLCPLEAFPELFGGDEPGADAFAVAPGQPPAVNARPNILGTASAPTSRDAPVSETSTIRHSIHGASGAGIRNPCLYRSARTRLRAPRSLRVLGIVLPQGSRPG